MKNPISYRKKAYHEEENLDSAADAGHGAVASARHGARVNDSSAPAVTYADLADINGTALVPDGAGENTELTVADAVRALLLWTGMTEQQLGSFPDDYLAQARSMGMIDTDTDADAPCTLAAYRQMKRSPTRCMTRCTPTSCSRCT